MRASAALSNVQVTGANLNITYVVLAISLLALAIAWVLRAQVLAASDGTEKMREIAAAVQEGAAAYLARQFRTVEGDPLNPRELRQSAERIRALGYFADAQCTDGRMGHLRYYTVPAEALESVAEMQPWAREAMASALRAKASKAPAKPRTRAASTAKP